MWCDFYGLHDRAHPANAALNTYRSSDGTWFVLVATPDKIPAVLKAMDREDILTDPRFSDPAKLAQNRPQLTACSMRFLVRSQCRIGMRSSTAFTSPSARA